MSATTARPAATPLPTGLTADEFYDFCQLPENDNRWFELVRGKVIEMSRPTCKHGIVSTLVGTELSLYTRRVRHGYVASNDSGVVLERNPDTVRGPDVAVYTDAAHYDDVHPKYGEEPPILAVEVPSPNDRMSKVTRKIADYLRNGVRVVWLLDPEGKDLTVYRATVLPAVLGADEYVEGDPELPGFRCRVGDFFVLPEDLPVPTPQP